ncbi:MAG: IS30 family transposase [Phycisphaerales bacterium]
MPRTARVQPGGYVYHVINRDNSRMTRDNNVLIPFSIPRRRIPGNREGRGLIPGRIGIEQRPPVVDFRGRFGDWESDTLEGAKGAGLLVTHVERKSRYLRIAQLADKRAATLTAVSNHLLADLPSGLRRTLTCDNGKEFADFATMQQALKVRVFFADPHAPWQRGTNENTNGLLRDFFPKGSDYRRISKAEVAKVQRMMNNRPRKCLNYRTPAEVLNALPGVALRI